MKAKTLTWFLLLLFLFAAIVSKAQRDSVNIYAAQSPFKGNYLKFSPFALLEPEPAIQLGYEYKKGNIRIQHELGYLSLFNPYYALFLPNRNFDDISSAGARIRTTFKFPLKLDNMYVRHKYKYLGIDVMFKYLSITQHDYNVRRMDAYWQMMDLTTNKFVGAVHFIYGLNNYISIANNIISDTYFGVGIRYKYFTDNYPVNESPDSLPWWDDFDGAMLSVMLGYKLGFGL